MKFNSNFTAPNDNSYSNFAKEFKFQKILYESLNFDHYCFLIL